MSDHTPEIADSTANKPQRTPRHPARKWIIATVVLLVALVGVSAWALSLRSDVDDKDAQIATLQRQLEEQQQGIADQLQEAASGFADDAQQAVSELGDQLDEVQGAAAASQDEIQDAIANAEKAASDAKARAESAADDEVAEAGARADEAMAQAEAVGACARGYISAIGSAFDAASLSEGVNQAKSDIEALNASCRDKLGS